MAGPGADRVTVPPIAARLAILRRLRHAIAADPRPLAGSAARPGAGEAEIMMAEVLPLLDALRFLERRAARLLRPRARRAGRPLWLFGTRLEVRRLPLGRVLIVGPRNYPLFLPGVHAMQALAAGNTVLIKPAPGRGAPMALLARLLAQAGLPEGALRVLDDSAAAARQALADGVDLVVLTGASATGRAVLADAAPHLTPCIMELSGDDPFIVLPGADMEYAAAALAFGQAFNGGDTCIAPRRVIVVREAEAAFRRACGGDVALTVVADAAAAIAQANAGRAVLGAAVFGGGAARVARALRAGCVVVGDVIAPTADPRLPFAGAGESGFGVTRGPEGLLAMTRPQAIVTRARPERRHLAPLSPRAAPVVAAIIRALHGGGLGGVAALPAALLAARRR